jgi:hypothetical protein
MVKSVYCGEYTLHKTKKVVTQGMTGAIIFMCKIYLPENGNVFLGFHYQVFPEFAFQNYEAAIYFILSEC